MSLDLDASIDGDDNHKADIIFDLAAETSNAKLMAGGYYLVFNTDGSKQFFRKLSEDLEWWYVPG